MITSAFSVTIPSELGLIRVSGIARGITEIGFTEREQRMAAGSPAFLEACAVQLREYLEGKRTRFDSLPLVYEATDFQKSVWEKAEDIPYGETRTYGQLAKEIGSEGASRAVGTALSRNPLIILVPCHRILPLGGTVEDCGQYAGGAWRKKWLLAHERR